MHPSTKNEIEVNTLPWADAADLLLSWQLSRVGVSVSSAPPPNELAMQAGGVVGRRVGTRMVGDLVGLLWMGDLVGLFRGLDAGRRIGLDAGGGLVGERVGAAALVRWKR